MPLSPLFANLVLANFDAEIERRKIPMVRYADDLAMFFKTKKDAYAGKELVSSLLKELDLGIPELESGSKTQIIGNSNALDFLGYELTYLSSAGKFVCRVSGKQIEKIKDDLIKGYSLESLSSEGSMFQEAIASVTRSISAYCGIYKNAYNAQEFQSEMKGVGRTILTNILAELFGTQAIKQLSDSHKKFLGIAIDEIEAIDDLEF